MKIAVLLSFILTLPLAGASNAAAPLRFEPNLGQAAPAARFVARGGGYTMLLSAKEAVFLSPAGAVHMKLTGATANAVARPIGRLPSVTNYYLGSDPQSWHPGVPNYERVQFDDVYPGIDLVYYAVQQRLEYDFVVHPGADPDRIRMAWTGVDSMRIDPAGDLVLLAHGHELRQRQPVVYQELDGHRVQIAGRYRIGKHGEVLLALAAYDRRSPLIVDPVLVYSTYLGGYTEDSANAIAVDSSGDAFITGSTEGGFPILNPEQPAVGGASDAFVTELSPTGTLVYSTYLGGLNSDSGAGIAVDSTGVYVTGYTSGGFPLLNAAQPNFSGTPVDDTNAFVTKLGPTGALLYSTYLGGPNTTANGIAIDTANAAYVTGQTTGSFPVLNAEQSTYGGGLNDAFVAKLDVDGAFVYATYLGGPNSDYATGIAVDSTGAAYVAGSTAGAFPVVNAQQPIFGGGGLDVFVAKLGPSGTLVYATYVGGATADYAGGIAVDSSGDAYITGQTFGDFPVVNAQQPTYGANGETSAFVTEINPSGSALLYSTYLGLTAQNGGAAIAVDSTGAAYVTGNTGSGFPVLNAEQPVAGTGASNAFVTKFTPSGAISYSTYLGGSIQDGGLGIAVDALGSAYITGYTSGAFPVLNAEQPAYGGGFAGGFVTKLSASGVPAFYLNVASSHSGNFAQGHANATYTVTVMNAATSTVATSGIITVTDILPPDLTLVSMTGSGWNCSSNICSRTDALGPGGSYPPITVTVDVSGTSNVSIVNTVNAAASDTAATAADPTNVTLAPPFGSFDTPAISPSNVSGSVAFTGWALSSATISSVDIWREPNPGEGPNLLYLGTAALIDGARPDVQLLYPNYPGSASAGWGYLILTNELPANNGNVGVGNGTYNIHAIAHDFAGDSTDLGTKTIVVDNQDATVPFGAIDTPVQGGIASGASYVNFGWALTPPPKNIPTDGSTIWVYIDNLPVGRPVYNNYRVDIATLFPGYANSPGAVGYYYIDTTQLANGLHTIAWVVTDNLGAATGIGSRFFMVMN